jgi:phosphoribosyl 1,2-cyclic phosphodiesterase
MSKRSERRDTDAAGSLEDGVSGKGVELRIWGARGSLPCPGPSTVRYGGNTACVEVRMGGHLVILDGGSGIRGLSAKMRHEAPIEADVLLSHYHLDHIIGLPFFSAAFKHENTLRFRGARLETDITLRQILAKMMSPPLFPVPIDVYQATTSFEEFDPGESFELAGGIQVETRPLNHPGGACGYRLSYNGIVIAYVTDTEHVPGQHCPNALALMRDADAVIYDATYTDEEFETYRGWGHSTWREANRLANLAGAETMILFHHDPNHDDAVMDRIAVEAAEDRAQTVVAREGLTLSW